MASKIGKLDAQKKPSGRAGKLGAQSTPTKTKTPKRTRRWDAGWLRFYKALAVTAVVTVLIAPFSFLYQWVGPGYGALYLSLILTPSLIAVGYGIQLLVLGRRRREEILGGDMDFSFESERIRLSPVQTAVACVLSVAVSALMAVPISKIMVVIYQDTLTPVNEEVGIPTFFVGCAVCAIIGCILVPFRFHQLLSIRTMIEFICALGLPIAFMAIWGGGASVTSTACVIVYMLCLAIAMNQEAVIKPSSSSSTCYPTSALRRAGVWAAVKFWLSCFALMLPVLSLICIPVAFFRGLIFAGRSDFFYRTFWFPFAGFPTVNFIIMVIGLVGVLVWGAFRLAHRTSGDFRTWLADFKVRLWIFLDALRMVLGLPDRSRMTGWRRVEGEPPPRHYRDTVSYEAVAGIPKPPSGYRAYLRRLHTLKDTDERFGYAYRTLVGLLCTESHATRLGLSKASTPLELAETLRSRTDLPDIDRLTHVFIDLTYAEGAAGHATAADVDALCAILADKYERRGGG